MSIHLFNIILSIVINMIAWNEVIGFTKLNVTVRCTQLYDDWATISAKERIYCVILKEILEHYIPKHSTGSLDSLRNRFWLSKCHHIDCCWNQLLYSPFGQMKPNRNWARLLTEPTQMTVIQWYSHRERYGIIGSIPFNILVPLLGPMVMKIFPFALSRSWRVVCLTFGPRSYIFAV